MINSNSLFTGLSSGYLTKIANGWLNLAGKGGLLICGNPLQVMRKDGDE
jgi:hypothetical protein